MFDVSKMTCDELNYWVARAEGIEHAPGLRKMEPGFVMVEADGLDEDGCRYHVRFDPAGDFSHGGPIIEREKIGLDTWQVSLGWGAQFTYPRETAEEKFSPSHCRMNGETSLIAAMRTYVACKFGPYFSVNEDGTTKVEERPVRPKFTPMRIFSDKVLDPKFSK